ncbi:hypothetical protein DRJ17_07115 [Candidatus Woesearchaeota archaeon]|nr:MAG: hypothetical protein DRJ17_07115 [Candidatus Woesearchaeota archaeon]
MRYTLFFVVLLLFAAAVYAIDYWGATIEVVYRPVAPITLSIYDIHSPDYGSVAIEEIENGYRVTINYDVLYYHDFIEVVADVVGSEGNLTINVVEFTYNQSGTYLVFLITELCNATVYVDGSQVLSTDEGECYTGEYEMLRTSVTGVHSVRIAAALGADSARLRFKVRPYNQLYAVSGTAVIEFTTQ